MGAFSGSGGNKHRVSTMAAKAGYIFIIALSAILALILYTYGDQISWLNDIPAISDICTNKGTTASQCYGASAVLRISLALCLFMTLNLLTCFSGDFFVGLWAVKVVVWLGLLIGMFFIPADAVEKYGQTARIFSILFIIAMALLLVDFAYHLQEVLVSKIEATHAQLKEKFADIGCCQNLWRWLYVGLVSALLIGSFIGIVLLYKFSANRPEGVQCGQNMGFLSATLVTGLIYLILSPLEWLGGSRGMLTPALIFAYCTWLCWSAIYANPNAQCNPVPPDTSNTGATIVGMLIAAGSLCYTAFSASRNLPHMFDMSAKKQAAIAAGGCCAGWWRAGFLRLACEGGAGRLRFSLARVSSSSAVDACQSPLPSSYGFWQPVHNAICRVFTCGYARSIFVSPPAPLPCRALGRGGGGS